MHYLGEPDGATEDLRAYIPVGKVIDFNFSDLSTKVIVGRKGSGKSLCMRKFQEYAQNQSNIYAIDYKSRNPDLSGIIKFSVDMPDVERTNIWQQLWRNAIFISVATIICFCKPTKTASMSFIPEDEINSFKKDFNPCLFGLEEVTHPYDIIEVLIERHVNHEQFLTYARSARTKNFESRIRLILDRCPKICFFLDALDEELRRAPALLIDVARALFYTAVHLAREPSANKLHVTVAIRDIIYSSVQTSEHADRYKNSQYISSLPWSKQLVREFAEKKIGMAINKARTNGAHWAPKTGSTLYDLLGFKVIRNTRKQCHEDVLDYFIRHTNYVPRNVIRLGNRIFDELRQHGKIDERLYKGVVNEISQDLAEQLLKVSSAYLIAAYHGKDIRYLVEVYEGFEEVVKRHSLFKEEKLADMYRASQSILSDGFVEPIKNFIKFIGTDVFTRDCLRSAIDEFTSMKIDEPHNHQLNRLENILWAQGLLGYRENKGGSSEDIFYYFSGMGTLATLPMDKKHYVFFPGLVQVCSLKIVRGVPVGGKAL